MLVIVIAVLVAVEILVLLIGTAIPNSRLTAQVKLEEEMKINVGPVQFSHIRESSSFSLFLVQGEGINQAIYIISCDNKKADVWIFNSVCVQGTSTVGCNLYGIHNQESQNQSPQ